MCWAQLICPPPPPMGIGLNPLIFCKTIIILSCTFQKTCKKCEQVDKQLRLYLMFSFLLVSINYFAKSVDRWTSSNKNQPHIIYHSQIGQICKQDACLSFSYFLSFLYHSSICKKCGQVDKKLFLYFMLSFFLVPYKMFHKSVDLWTRSCFLLHVFFLSCTLPNVLQKCGLVDKKLFFYFMFSFSLVPFIFWQKVWTGGQALKILKILMTTFFRVPFKIFAKNVDGWTRRCFYILCFFLFCTL